ncbi:MAG: NADH-quinone oxidoreductase subunit C, partial [Lysobacterales bacterium]
GIVITLRVLVDHDSPELDSIAPMYPAAEWIEREIWELLGIHFKGHPDMRHLLLADDWPEGNYPMRRNHEVTP